MMVIKQYKIEFTKEEIEILCESFSNSVHELNKHIPIFNKMIKSETDRTSIEEGLSQRIAKIESIYHKLNILQEE